ncbi:hypothetical protein ACH42_06395 [Endozoicomonas sp. (ex Bugula neritina AB1)]|nr:hypothetical protein ACH42_06395 [Endozoicomonas sp. (ex Bugula neritina AB1)]
MPVLGTFRTIRISGLWLTVFFFAVCLLNIPKATAEPLIVSGGSSIPLHEHLEITTPPDILFKTSDLSGNDENNIWYKFELQTSQFNAQNWLIQFRQVPFQQLDFFSPFESGYRLHKLGSDSLKTPPTNFTVDLDLASENSKTFYIRYQSVSPNALNPHLWPDTTFQQIQSNQNLILSSVQLLLLAILIFVFAQYFSQQTRTSYLIISHTLVASTLLLFWQGDVFRTFSWLGDPGHWVAATTIITLVIALNSYRQLTALSTYSPLLDKLILGSCTLAVAMMVYFFSQPESLPPVILETVFLTLAGSYSLLILGALHCLYNGIHPARSTLFAAGLTLIALSISWNHEPWPRSLPSYPELLVLSIQAIMLPAIHWYHLYLSESQSMALNVVNTNDRKRRIYESALRQHLQNPDSTLDESDIPNRVLSTLEAVTPNIPAIILIYSDNEWHMIGDPSKPAQQLRSQLSSIQDDLLQVISTNQDTKINFKDRFGHLYWIFPLREESNRMLLLAMAPTRSQRTSLAWQMACDISSHARTLLQASQQSQFWQQQACLDSLTGLLNRRAFYQEAEQKINQSYATEDNPPCCALFIDIDHFKRVNDQHGHAKGDQILKLAANTCRQVLRHQDLLGRYGGEEFIALLPNTEPWQAFHVAERIRRHIAASEGLQGDYQITLSIGLAALSHQINTLEMLVEDADKAMYLAKQRGRNQTCISPYLSDARLPSQKA